MSFKEACGGGTETCVLWESQDGRPCEAGGWPTGMRAESRGEDEEDGEQVSRPGLRGVGEVGCRGRGEARRQKELLVNSPEQLCCVGSRGIAGKGEVAYKECFCFILER